MVQDANTCILFSQAGHPSEQIAMCDGFIPGTSLLQEEYGKPLVGRLLECLERFIVCRLSRKTGVIFKSALEEITGLPDAVTGSDLMILICRLYRLLTLLEGYLLWVNTFVVQLFLILLNRWKTYRLGDHTGPDEVQTSST